MSNICPFYYCMSEAAAKRGIEECSGDQEIKWISCNALLLSKNKGITKDMLHYCFVKKEECSRYQKACSRYQKAEKVGETVERVGKFFKRR